jgi:hypothetical protein
MRTRDLRSTCVLLACALTCLLPVACVTTPLDPRQSAAESQQLGTDIHKPLATVNAVVPAALESCGLAIDKRKFDNGVVTLESLSESGQRIRVRLSPVTQQTTHVLVESDDEETPEGLIVQILKAIRDRVWS